uniref:Uncharacterized protein n=1 Tax=Arundo donax TaxID=35708 RepID=A0A0A9HWW4_ARUDO
MEASGYHLNLKKRRNRERRSKSEAYERLMMLRSRIKEASRLENVVDEEERKEDHEIASFRSYWERCYADCYGSFEDTSKPIQSNSNSMVSPRSINLTKGFASFKVTLCF